MRGINRSVCSLLNSFPHTSLTSDCRNLLGLAKSLLIILCTVSSEAILCIWHSQCLRIPFMHGKASTTSILSGWTQSLLLNECLVLNLRKFTIRVYTLSGLCFFNPQNIERDDKYKIHKNCRRSRQYNTANSVPIFFNSQFHWDLKSDRPPLSPLMSKYIYPFMGKYKYLSVTLLQFPRRLSAGRYGRKEKTICGSWIAVYSRHFHTAHSITGFT